MTVWYIGAAALCLKSYSLFAEAYAIDADIVSITLLLALGTLLGLLKTRYIFTHALSKNMIRIDSLELPKIWQFYRVSFFVFLLGVISLGAYLSRVAHGDYLLLVSVGVVDMSLSIGLSLSGILYAVQHFTVEHK